MLIDRFRFFTMMADILLEFLSSQCWVYLKCFDGEKYFELTVIIVYVLISFTEFVHILTRTIVESARFHVQ